MDQQRPVAQRVEERRQASDPVRGGQYVGGNLQPDRAAVKSGGQRVGIRLDQPRTRPSPKRAAQRKHADQPRLRELGRVAGGQTIDAEHRGGRQADQLVL
jgi:hypothetical protein